MQLTQSDGIMKIYNNRNRILPLGRIGVDMTELEFLDEILKIIGDMPDLIKMKSRWSGIDDCEQILWDINELINARGMILRS